MIFDLLIAGVCLYMSYTNIQMLAGIPFNSWGIEQYLLVAVTLLLSVVGIYKAYKLVTAFITAQKRTAGQAEELKKQGQAEQDAASGESDEPEDDSGNA